MLKTEHIEAICWLAQDDDLVGVELNDEAAAPCFAAIEALRSELLRRKVGPFTLAEAVASGRPFRRKGAGYWTRKAPAPGDGEPFFEAMTAFDKWEPCPSVSDQHGFTVAEEWLSIDDITACDYELNLDGGD